MSFKEQTRARKSFFDLMCLPDLIIIQGPQWFNKVESIFI